MANLAVVAHIAVGVEAFRALQGFVLGGTGKKVQTFFAPGRAGDIFLAAFGADLPGHYYHQNCKDNVFLYDAWGEENDLP
jgi:hypothetical protein